MPPVRSAAAGVAVVSLALLGASSPQRTATAPPPPPRIEGVVRDAAGRPVEKALVVVRARGASLFQRALTARSDAAGRFSIALDRAGEYALRVESPGLAPDIRERVPVPGPALAVTLRKGGAIEGVVKDASGKPVAGARVEARARSGPRAPLALDPDAGRVRAMTDARGGFRIEGLAAVTHTVTASARALGYARRDGTAPGTRLELILVPGAAVLGTVRGTDGRPLAGASVVLQPEMPGSPTGTAERSDERGAFQFWGVAPGAWRVVAWHAERAPAVANLTIERNTQQTVALTLGAPARITGRLVDTEGRPLQCAIALQEIDGQPVVATLGDLLRTDSDARGRFALDGLPRAAVALGATARGFAARRVEAAPAGPVADLGDLTLEPGLAITGRVRDAAGGPVADAHVSAQTSGTTPRRLLLETRSEADGRFTLGGADPGAYFVHAEAPGFAAAGVRASTGGEPVALVLERAGSITGSVVDEKGAPVAVFEVLATPVGEDMRRPEFADGTEGRFEVEDVAAGEWTLQVRARARAEARVSAVKVRAGAATDVGRVRLTSGATVRGRVTDAAGSPVAGANVWVETPDRMDMAYRSGDRGTYTDASGAFELRGIASGRVDLVGYHPDFASGRLAGYDVEAARSDAEARIVLPRGGRIEGVVRRRDGRPLEAMQVQANIVNGRAPGSRSPVAPDGSFTIEHVPAGGVRLVLLASGGDNAFTGLQQRQVDVAEGETVTADFLLRDVLVSGTVTRGGQPAAGLRILLRGRTFPGFYGAPSGAVLPPVAGPQRGWAVTRTDGTYELLVSDPGSYTASMTSADGRITYPGRPVEVPDAEAFIADFAIGGATVSGVVVDADTGRPLQAQLMAVPERSGPERRSTNATGGTDGRFEMELEPGKYTITAMADGYAAATTSVAVGESPIDGLRFALGRGARIAGRIVDGAGRSVGSVFVTAFPDPDDGTPVPMWRMGFTHAAPDGTFSMTGLTAGTYALSTADELTGFALLPGVSTGTSDVLLRLMPGGRLRAHVLKPDGSPAGEAFVGVRRLNDHLFRGSRGGQTDASGIADLAVPAGRLEVRAATNPSEEGTAAVTVAPGENATVEIKLAPRPAGPGTR